MRFKVMIKFVVLFFFSMSAMASNDQYFFPPGTWTGSYTAACNNQLPFMGTAVMQVQALSISRSGSLLTEDFAGSLKLENLPAQCNPPFDFKNGAYFAKGTMAKASDMGSSLIPAGISMLMQTNTGAVDLEASYPSLNTVIISRVWENFTVTIVLSPPKE